MDATGAGLAYRCIAIESTEFVQHILEVRIRPCVVVKAFVLMSVNVCARARACVCACVCVCFPANSKCIGKQGAAIIPSPLPE